ncbi:hypothetical protein [Streptomyces sp. NPDC096013]|uniref:hypothetical protein n=1 Tax=Streptomyces sp. NPDC096013 TaxID=3366069 RepID=UPI00382745CC
MKLVLFGATGTIAGRVAAACAPPRGGSPRSSEPGTGGGSDPRDPLRALDDGPGRTYASPVSPAAATAPGTRTGRLRVDEMERHTHPRARMPVAY